MTSDFRLRMSEMVSKCKTLQKNLKTESAIIPKKCQLLKTKNHIYWIFFFNFDFWGQKLLLLFKRVNLKKSPYLHIKSQLTQELFGAYTTKFFIANTTKLGWRSKLENQTIYLESSIKAKIMSKLWTWMPSKTCQMAKHN